MRITEGVEGYYVYHLSKDDKLTRGLCGAKTMRTEIPFELWGTITHLNERYCIACEKEACRDAEIREG